MTASTGTVTGVTIDDTLVPDTCATAWDGIVPVLHEDIAIPNVSPDFDAHARRS